jgi:hypothetical protein
VDDDADEDEEVDDVVAVVVVVDDVAVAVADELEVGVVELGDDDLGIDEEVDVDVDATLLSFDKRFVLIFFITMIRKYTRKSITVMLVELKNNS